MAKFSRLAAKSWLRGTFWGSRRSLSPLLIGAAARARRTSRRFWRSGGRAGELSAKRYHKGNIGDIAEAAPDFFDLFVVYLSSFGL